MYTYSKYSACILSIHIYYNLPLGCHTPPFLHRIPVETDRSSSDIFWLCACTDIHTYVHVHVCTSDAYLITQAVSWLIGIHILQPLSPSVLHSLSDQQRLLQSSTWPAPHSIHVCINTTEVYHSLWKQSLTTNFFFWDFVSIWKASGGLPPVPAYSSEGGVRCSSKSKKSVSSAKAAALSRLCTGDTNMC